MTHARTDTIVAIATVPGRAAVAIVRLSGADAERIARRVVAPWPTTPRTLSRCTVREALPEGVRTADGCSSVELDRALVVHFPAPHSYTGESMVELHTHGGFYIPRAVEAALLAAGARSAQPGEFTERAVLNGKLDLIRAEAVAELIDARTRAAHRLAVHGMSGAKTREYAALREQAVALEALIAFEIDFPEEDHGPLPRARVDEVASALEARLARLVLMTRATSVARDGATVVLAGPPNAGKSSLLNALVGMQRAIVSDEPGTTRDAIEVLLDADPWPIRLVDTAGLRSDGGIVERLGIEVSERYLASADVVVVCGESPAGLQDAQAEVARLSSAPMVGVLTKADTHMHVAPTGVISVSSRDGTGVETLRRALEHAVAAQMGGTAMESAVAGNARQSAALAQAHTEISAFLAAWRAHELPAPLAATHLLAAIGALDQIIGVIDTDEVFAKVFSTFCIGK